MYIPNNARWKNAFKPKGVKKGGDTKVQVGEGSAVRVVTPSQQTVDQAKSEITSSIHKELQGVLQAGDKKRHRMNPRRKQVRSAPGQKKKGKSKSTSKQVPKKKKK